MGHDGMPRYHDRQIISFEKCTLISPITPLHAPGLGSTGVSFVLASACTLMLLLNEGFAPAILISKGEVVMRWTIHRQERRENGSNAAMWPEEVIFRRSRGAPTNLIKNLITFHNRVSGSCKAQTNKMVLNLKHKTSQKNVETFQRLPFRQTSWFRAAVKRQIIFDRELSLYRLIMKTHLVTLQSP